MKINSLRLTQFLWPLAIILVVYDIGILAVNGSPTDDFTTVYSAIRRFLNGTDVYNETYFHVDPHYLYNPGATLLLAPMGLIPQISLARAIFVIVNAAAIIGALAVVTASLGYNVKSWLWPAMIAGSFATETVRSTLIFSNINGILFLILALYLWAFTQQKTWLSGLLLGFAITIKPLFVPLIFLHVVKIDIRGLAASIGLPVLINLIALPLVPGASRYISDVMPYLSQTRDYANSSLRGMAAYVDAPWALTAATWIVIALCVAITVVGLLYWRHRDPYFWAASTSGILLIGVFTLSSLGQQYYSMLAFPLVATVVKQRSLLHSWPAWLCTLLFLFPAEWRLSKFPSSDTGQTLQLMNLAGLWWSGFLLVAATTVVVWLRQELSAGENRYTGKELVAAIFRGAPPITSEDSWTPPITHPSQTPNGKNV